MTVVCANGDNHGYLSMCLLPPNHDGFCRSLAEDIRGDTL